MNWQNRITGLEHHTASELMDHAGNWRTHPKHQADALAGVLGEVGIVDALLVYHSKRQGGLTVIDGHLRKELDKKASWPCLMTDLSDDEADLVLASLDPIANLAGSSSAALSRLLSTIESDNLAINDLLNSIAPPSIPPNVELPEIDLPSDRAVMPEHSHDREEDEYEAEERPRAPMSDVRMVTLFFDPVMHKDFTERCHHLQNMWGAESLSHTVFEAIAHAYHQNSAAS